jgi:hypothetical protein
MVAILEKLFFGLVISVAFMFAFYFYLFKPVDMFKNRAMSLGHVQNGNLNSLIQSICYEKRGCISYKQTLNECAFAANIDQCVKIKNPKYYTGKYLCNDDGETSLTVKYSDIPNLCFIQDNVSKPFSIAQFRDKNN